MFSGFVTLCCEIFEILHFRYVTSTGWLESLCFRLFLSFVLWFLFGLVDFGDFYYDHAGEIYLTGPLEW